MSSLAWIALSMAAISRTLVEGAWLLGTTRDDRQDDLSARRWM